MAITNVVFAGRGRKQFQGVFETVLEIEALYNPPSVNSNSFQSESISAVGVALGDFVFVSFEADLQELTLSGHIDAADSISIHLVNHTAGAIDLPENQLHVIILRPIHRHG